MLCPLTIPMPLGLVPEYLKILAHISTHQAWSWAIWKAHSLRSMILSLPCGYRKVSWLNHPFHFVLWLTATKGPVGPRKAPKMASSLSLSLSSLILITLGFSSNSGELSCSDTERTSTECVPLLGDLETCTDKGHSHSVEREPQERLTGHRSHLDSQHSGSWCRRITSLRPDI